ncbi:hypothetical protein P4637_02650 [Halalkalibacterium halodurans]|jgi:hypothetical protein|uniref:BH3745 protein n=1 Tax=Halalkalibacterium halodurans (strain ATCC BAA-125 / DSM 18197 / FERM 7344 / JCM 9153 / C-125) TaxID=272558 RepID=Q9K6I4_HALH5|nr:hypothetical protein [Halalkalibacterium halodurans]MDY7224251.1 hypothetical protein [Halalkalibacterium halodurans]MDY7243536.1 hypothetical protein [Halalkalibacterium halodurans]MED3647231.1 hypothetical protein [Halalkalibacterium halodurans]MED4079813.1 hypothetical protein [Halalkalibacterium halodurans]MED4083761.1 hypothetical protein [Halalkalibacterium halodurans]
MIYLFLLLIVASIFACIRYKRPLFLTVPFAGILLVMIVQIAMVPMGFFETIRFIFSLR